MNFNLFEKPKEAQEVVVKNILAGYGGNMLFPLPFFLMTDITEKEPILFYSFVAFVFMVATFHFSLGLFFDKTLKFFGKKNWNRLYLFTFSLEALYFTPACIYFMYHHSIWSPEFLFSMIIWGMAFESFGRFTSAYIETFFLASACLVIPLVAAFSFHGWQGLTMILLVFCYFAYTGYSTFLSYKQFKQLVNERKKSQNSAKSLKTFIDVVPAKVAQFNMKLEVEMANQRFLDPLNLKKSDLLSQLDPFLVERMRTFVSRGEVQTSFEFETDKFTGEKRWYQVRLNLEDDERITLLAYDIQEIKTAAQELELQKAKTINATRLAALGEMAGGIAHEINNPLTIIAGQNSILQRSLKKGELSPDKIQNITEKISALVDRIAKTIQGMKNLSRQEDEIELQVHALNPLLEDVTSLCHQKFVSHRVDFQSNIDDLDLNVVCQYQQTGQVLINLLNNAFDEVVELKEPMIQLWVSHNDDFVFIDVKDNGKGIADESKMFQPFYTTKAFGKGMGLGLSLSKKIAQKSGGDLIYSREDSWTVFRFIVPKAKSMKKLA